MENDIQELHATFEMYGKNAKAWMRKCIMLLPEIAHKRVWQKKGYENIYEYARVFAGMSGHAVDEALRVLKRAEQLPAIQKVIEAKGINAVRPIITVATPETDAFWAKKAEEMSQHALDAYVRATKYQYEAEILGAENLKAEITMQLPKDLAEKLMKLKGHGEWENLLNELLAYREQVLQENQPEEKVTDARHIPAEIKRFVIERSRGICEFPRCTRTYTILHHTQRFALEPTHDPARIIALCTPHERLAHQGLMENENLEPQYWKVRERADIEHPTYAIDELVMKYRKPG